MLLDASITLANYIIKYYLIVGIDKEMYGFCKMHLDKYQCNSICQKTGNKSAGTTLSMLIICSKCLICILKVKYTECKFPYFTTDLSA